MVRKVLNHPALIELKNDKDGYSKVLKSFEKQLKDKKTDFLQSGKFVVLNEILGNLNFDEEDQMEIIQNPNKILIFS